MSSSFFPTELWMCRISLTNVWCIMWLNCEIWAGSLIATEGIDEQGMCCHQLQGFMHNLRLTCRDLDIRSCTEVLLWPQKMGQACMIQTSPFAHSTKPGDATCELLQELLHVNYYRKANREHPSFPSNICWKPRQILRWLQGLPNSSIWCTTSFEESG